MIIPIICSVLAGFLIGCLVTFYLYREDEPYNTWLDKLGTQQKESDGLYYELKRVRQENLQLCAHFNRNRPSQKTYFEKEVI